MTNLKTTELGKINEIANTFENGKAFLHDTLGLTSCEVSISTMLAGTKLPFNHKHKQNEEIYIFLKGEAVMMLDNKTVDAKEGSCVKVLPNAVRTMEAKTDVQYICIQARENSLVQFGLSDAELC